MSARLLMQLLYENSYRPTAIILWLGSRHLNLARVIAPHALHQTRQDEITSPLRLHATRAGLSPKRALVHAYGVSIRHETGRVVCWSFKIIKYARDIFQEDSDAWWLRNSAC